AVLDRHLHDRALHRRGQRIPAGGPSSCPLPVPSGGFALRFALGRAAHAQPGRQHHLQAFPADLHHHPLHRLLLCSGRRADRHPPPVARSVGRVCSSVCPCSRRPCSTRPAAPPPGVSRRPRPPPAPPPPPRLRQVR